MPITPKDILDVAISLDAIPVHDEVLDRTIVNRAYYSSYHMALAIIDKFALPEAAVAATGSHQRRLNRLMRCEKARTEHSRTINAIGYIVARVLNPHRTVADYQLADTVSPTMKDEALERSKFVYTQASSIL